MDNIETKDESFVKIKENAKDLYEKSRKIFCPYFNSEIILNSDGFHHLQFSARRERNKSEQILKFNLLPLALKTIRKSGTIQEYRCSMMSYGNVGKDGLQKMKRLEYWAFIAIPGEDKKIKIKTIVRRVGDGNIIFWSVMPYSKLRNGQKMYSGDLEEE